jgi:predicted nucleic acid-binding protein
MLVVLDACVLYPPSLRDLLLTLAAPDAFDVCWNEPILEELSRNVVADNPQLDPVRFNAHTLGEMRKHFPQAMTTVTKTEIDRLDNHPKDRHVAAVGVARSADAIVTINLKDFASQVLDEADVAVVTPGQLVERVLDEAPELIGYAVRRMSSRWTNPPRSAVEVVELLAGHPTMAAVMGRIRALVT